MMDIEILHGELERLFELDELLRLSESVLGFEPDAVGGTSAKGSFAGSLTKYCVEHEALEALCDAVLAIKPDANPKLAELRLGSTAHDDDLRLGDAFGPFTIVRKIGEGRLGVTYLARKEEKDFRLKLLRSAAVHDRRGVQRFLTVVRVIAAIEHAGLPKQLTAERSGHRVYIAHEYVEGQALSARINRTGPMHINEARDILRAVLEPLQAIHQRRLAHGDLRLENLITYRDAEGQPKILLLDAGADRLRVVPNMKNGHAEFFAGVLSPRTVAPEQVRGLSSDPRSDVYSFGALLYEILSGKPMFADKTPVLATVAHLTEVPAPPSSVAPRGWVSSEVDDFVLALLARDPDKRPQNAAALLEALERLGKSDGAKPEIRISDEDLDKRCEALKETPLDGEAALKLEASVDEGADPLRVAEVFAAAAAELDASEDDAKKSAKKSLLFRAARLFQNRAKTPDRAEQVYAALLDLDPEDEIATAALEDVRRQLGKYEELIEMLVVRGEQATDSIERARAFAEIGSIYKDDLDDEEQAVVAFTQAFCADPEHHEYSDMIERHAKKRAETWNEVLGVCAQAVTDESLSTERKHALLLTMGRWYGEKLQRADLALPCLQAVLQDDPAHQTALEAMTQIYRKSQQWPELTLVLMRRADATVVASRGRELKAEAAEVLEHQLNDTGGARDLYEQILAADPFHGKASAALAKIYERTGDFAGQVRILESRLLGLRGDEKLKEMCRIAEVYEDRLNDNEEATRRYQAVLAEDANHLEALRGLDRLFSKVGRYRELLENLKAQAALAVTPRQKITFWERAAAIHDEEFLDHREAAEALEKVLEIDAAHEASIIELVRHYRALDRWEDVTALYERQLKLVTAPEHRVEILLSLGRVFSEQIGSPDRATASYERVLEINPEHAGALEALARLRESAGDADAALKAIEALAVKATTAEAKAEQYLRAAKLLEGRGDRDGAVERYKMALDANPKDVAAAFALRSAFLARGDVNAAMQLLDREIQQIEGDRAKAKLAGEMAILARDRLKDDKRAKEAAERALTFDPTNLDALTILGDLAFDAKRHLEAARHYEVLAERAATLDKREAARILVRFVDALSQTGSTEKALAPMDTLLRIAPDDLEALERVAYVTFEHGSPKRAVELYADILERFTDKLQGTQRAGIVYRYGEALRQSEQYDKALGFLEESADLDPSNPAPLVALAKAHEARSDWEQVVKTKSRHLDLANGDERVQLLVEIGEIASSKLNDRTQAAKNFVAALDERPDDRRLLGKLMQLYSEEKDWNKLVEVVLRLAEFVDDPKQKAKYLHTAANITGRQIGDAERAIEYYEQALALDGTMDKALDEAIELQRDRGEHRAVEPLLKRRLERATAAKDEAVMLVTFSELGELYEKKLGWVNEAIDAFEAAQTLDPDNRERAAHLAQLYITDPEKYLDKAVASQEAILRQNPYRPESYKLLRRLYTEVKRADAAWCLCQGLFVLNLAEPDEERFFKRMRADTAAAAQQALTDEDWLRLVMHPDADALLTSVFALIEPAVIGRRGQSLEELGYDPRYAIDLSMHPYPMSQTLHYAAGVLGMDAPPTFQNMNDHGGLSFLHAHSPSIVLGVAALSANVPPQAAAFIAARHLTYFRPGMYLRHLVPTFTGLKSWLFAAIKLNAPQFPVSPDLEGPVREAITALEAGLPGQTRDHLSRVVSKLIQSGAALDLKKWVAGVDLTADRAGAIVAHDLETAAEIIKASEEGSSAVANQDRLKELVLYAVSEPYFELRQTLGISIDS